MTESNLLACSWSGGKDSAYAFHLMLEKGWRPGALITMLTEDGERSRSHGIHRSILEAQAERVGAPLIVRATSWARYADSFVNALRESADLGAEACVFGDMDFDDNRAWEEKVCSAAGLTAHIPLWQARRDDYVASLIRSGFNCRLIAVKEGVLSKRLLGRELDESLVRELGAAGVDLAGEAGEYHTLIVSCPLFTAPLHVVERDAVLRDGVWFLDLSLAGGC